MSLLLVIRDVENIWNLSTHAWFSLLLNKGGQFPKKNLIDVAKDMIERVLTPLQQKINYKIMQGMYLIYF
jgi:hypothetical protein